MARKYTLKKDEGLRIGDELTLRVRQPGQGRPLCVEVLDLTGSTTGTWPLLESLTLRGDLRVRFAVRGGGVLVKVVEQPSYAVEILGARG